jgi:epoxide hydrolase
MADATTAVQPFQIHVADDVLDDLHERLRRTRFPGEVADSGWTYGTNLAYLKELVEYWLKRYDWRAAEARLNALPQFMATVDGLRLHFVHVKGNGPRPLPLLISHGWPGSFVEMLDVIGPLTDPLAYGGDPADAFDVVVPSLPGYGFSEQPTTPGIGPRQIGALFASLMHDTLGYTRYGVQGGDWGAVITGAMARDYPDQLAGWHMNMLGARPNTGEGAAPLSDEEKAFVAEAGRWRDEEAGYQAIHGTRPQTLAYGLTDSPAGLAGWIVEKFRAWSDCNGDVESVFSKDELLTNIMIYWVTGCIGSSIRLYYESRHSLGGPGVSEAIRVPTGYAAFPHELTRPPQSWVERAVPLRRFSKMPRGGHFAAMEQPELLVEDVRAFFRPLREG